MALLQDTVNQLASWLATLPGTAHTILTICTAIIGVGIVLVVGSLAIIISEVICPAYPRVCMVMLAVVPFCIINAAAAIVGVAVVLANIRSGLYALHPSRSGLVFAAALVCIISVLFLAASIRRREAD